MIEPYRSDKASVHVSIGGRQEDSLAAVFAQDEAVTQGHPAHGRCPSRLLLGVERVIKPGAEISTESCQIGMVEGIHGLSLSLRSSVHHDGCLLVGPESLPIQSKHDGSCSCNRFNARCFAT